MEGGYGAWSDQVAETIRKVYETDGVYLDMTYTGKAFHGMMNYIRENNIRGKISSSCTPADFRCFLIFWRMNEHEKTDDPGGELFTASPL